MLVYIYLTQDKKSGIWVCQVLPKKQKGEHKMSK